MGTGMPGERRGFLVKRLLLNGTVQVLQCCSKSHPITGHCDKPSAVTSEALKMWLFLLMAKRVAVNDCCGKRGILWEDSP